MTAQPDAGEISRMLGAQIERLARDLLPAGKRQSGEWRVGSLDNEPGGSLAVYLSGARQGRWADYSTGEFGDALDLVAQVRYRGNKADALRWARGFLGLGDAGASPEVQRQTAVSRPTVTDDAEKRRKRAVAIWVYEAVPLRPGDPVMSYLAGRGIDLGSFDRPPGALRYHDALYCSEVDARLPAMVAAVTDASGTHVATHRTWLSRDRAGQWRKARLRSPKKLLGSAPGGTIRLRRGASNRPIAEAEDGSRVVIGEGIETCLSIAVACPEERVIAGVSLGNMAAIRLPPAIRTVLLAADNDGDNPSAQKGFARVIAHFRADGRNVGIVRAPIGKDFNDTLLAFAS